MKNHKPHFISEKMKFQIMIIFQILFLIGCQYTYHDNNELIIKNVNIIPMTHDTILLNKTIIVKDGTIFKINDVYNPLKSNANVIDGNNSFVLPGLSDMHMHFPEDGYDELILKLYLLNGVTTIRSLNGSLHQLRLKQQIMEGRIVGPSMLCSGPILGELEDKKINIESNNIINRIIRQKNQGYDCIKFYTFLADSIYYAGMQKANELEMYTVGHIPYSVGLDGVIKAKMNEIAHIEELLYEFLVDFDPQKPNAFGLEIDTSRIVTILLKIKNSGIKLCTTLAIDKAIIDKLLIPKEYLERPEMRFLPSEIYQQIKSGSEHHQLIFKENRDIIKWYELYKLILRKAGEMDIPLICGTDAGAFGVIHGFSLLDELIIISQNGFTNYETLKIATVGSAKSLGIKNIGTIQQGNAANFIILQKNPLDNISNLKSITGTVVFGQYYSLSRLDSLINQEYQKRKRCFQK